MKVNKIDNVYLSLFSLYSFVFSDIPIANTKVRINKSINTENMHLILDPPLTTDQGKTKGKSKDTGKREKYHKKTKESKKDKTCKNLYPFVLCVLLHILVVLT